MSPNNKFGGKQFWLEEVLIQIRFGKFDSTNRIDIRLTIEFCIGRWLEEWCSTFSISYLGMNYQIINVIFEYFQSECIESFLRFFLFSKQKIKCTKRAILAFVTILKKKRKKNILLFSIRFEIGYYKNNFRFDKEFFVCFVKDWKWNSNSRIFN